MKAVIILLLVIGAGAGGAYWYSTENQITPETVIADNNGSVVVYTSSNCEDCDHLVKYLARRDVAHKVYDINESDEAFKHYQKLGGSELPTTLVNGRMLAGFNRDVIKAELGTRVSNANVVLYSRPGCGYCDLARKDLTENKIAFQEHNVEASSEAAREFKKLGGKGVPLTVFNNKVVPGYSKEAYRNEIAKL